MPNLKNLEHRLVQLESGLLIALIAVIVALSFLQVALRCLFSTGILWADTLLRHLVLWTGFLGACLAAASNKQFAMDASARLLSGKTKHLIQALCHAFTAGVCWFLFSASVSFFREEYAHSAALFAVSHVNVPIWIFELILPGGFGLLFLHYIIKTLACLQELKQ